MMFFVHSNEMISLLNAVYVYFVPIIYATYYILFLFNNFKGVHYKGRWVGVVNYILFVCDYIVRMP